MIACFADKIEAIIIDGTEVSKNCSVTTIATQDVDFFPQQEQVTAQKTITVSQTPCFKFLYFYPRPTILIYFLPFFDTLDCARSILLEISFTSRALYLEMQVWLLDIQYH